MEARIKTFPKTHLIGKRMCMSFKNNTTQLLWKEFMPLRNTIENTKGNDLFSMQIYPPNFLDTIDYEAQFEKWATKAVKHFDVIPEGMETFTIPEGLYAVFYYIGDAKDAGAVFQFILKTWIPNSIYHLDDRPHFEILGDKYKKDSPESEEDIWIPIK